MTKKFEQFLNLTPIEEIKKEVDSTQIAIRKKMDTNEEDYDSARGYILKSLETMSSAIDRLEEIAESSQHPRAYEVLIGAAKTLSSISMELLELKKLDIDIDKSLEKINAPNVVNQNLFVGSTSELLDLIEKNKK